jgi:hypothetical protein
MWMFIHHPNDESWGKLGGGGVGGTFYVSHMFVIFGFCLSPSAWKSEENNENLNALLLFSFFFFRFPLVFLFFPFSWVELCREWGAPRVAGGLRGKREIFHLSNRMMMMMVVLDMKFVCLKGKLFTRFSETTFCRGGVSEEWKAKRTSPPASHDVEEEKAS